MIQTRRLLPFIPMLVAALLVAPTAAQQSATPAPWEPIPPSECTVAPRSAEELRTLTQRGIDQYLAESTGTPAASMPLATSVAEEGVPADPETMAAVTETMRMYVACTNAGNFPAVFALLTEESFVRSLGRATIYLSHVFAGGSGTPGPEATPDSAFLELYFTGLAVPRQLRPAEWSGVIEVRDVVVLADGRVRATVVGASENAPEPEAAVLYFREVDGRYLLDFDRTGGDSEISDATPAP